MKEAIEKAIKNGFDLQKQLFPYAISHIYILSWYYLKFETSPASKGTLKVFSRQPDMLHNCVNYFSLPDLVFTTDFIDKLVGEGSWCVYRHKNPSVRDCFPPYCGWCDEPNAMNCSSYNRQGQSIADYHRANMANIRDIDKLKEYVRKLI